MHEPNEANSADESLFKNNKSKINSTAKIPQKFNKIYITEKARCIVDDRVS
jgi:hypothetical protein